MRITTQCAERPTISLRKYIKISIAFKSNFAKLRFEYAGEMVYYFDDIFTTFLFVNFREIAMRNAHGLEADVWSLGCMLYTFLIGRPPFDTQAVKSTLNRVIAASYDVPAHLSAEAKSLICSLLKKNPKERLSLAGEYNVQKFRSAKKNRPHNSPPTVIATSATQWLFRTRDYIF